jgi:hypothetical protein
MKPYVRLFQESFIEDKDVVFEAMVHPEGKEQQQKLSVAIGKRDGKEYATVSYYEGSDLVSTHNEWNRPDKNDTWKPYKNEWLKQDLKHELLRSHKTPLIVDEVLMDKYKIYKPED